MTTQDDQAAQDEIAALEERRDQATPGGAGFVRLRDEVTAKKADYAYRKAVGAEAESDPEAEGVHVPGDAASTPAGEAPTVTPGAPSAEG